MLYREQKDVLCPKMSRNSDVRQEMDTQDMRYKQAIRQQASMTDRQQDFVARDLRGGHQEGKQVGYLTVCP